jgi:5-formyltetrahydrofolate cyclo-ligase
LLVDAVELEVTQIGKECHAACEIRKIVGDCIMPREGIFARVITGGKIRAGNTILVKEPTQDRHSRAVPSGAKESAALKEQKRTMRKETLAARRSLTPDELARRSRAIAERLNSIPEFRDARALLIYVSSKDNEVDTLEPIRNALDDNRMVLVPVAMPSTREILWSQLRSLDDLEPSTFGILEPRNDRVRPVEPTEADVAIIPGIAFDAAGHRIGYGGGYYDRFLGKFRGTKIALAYELQIRDSIPVEPHDLPVDTIVTEKRIVWCH